MRINDLSDDCMLKIFLLLSATERVRNELVCARWRALLPRAFIDFQQLDVADFIVRTYKTHYQADSIHLTPTIVGILTRCGPFLREISFGSRWLKVSQPVIDTIAEKCGRLVNVNLGCVILHADVRPVLRQLGPRLLAFSLDETHWTREEDADGVEDDLPYMRCLKKLSLKRVPFGLSTLAELPIDLEMINLSGARRLQLDPLQAFLLTRTALRELHLSNFQRMEQSALDIIASMQALTVLDLSCLNRDDLDLSPIACLKGTLRQLYLQSNNSLHDPSFHCICLECSDLSVLDVSNCRRLRDFSILQYCRNLVTFLTSNTPQICDADLAELATSGNLRSLTLSHCVNVGSAGLTAIARRCPLREICVSQCLSVDDSTLLALADNHRPIPVISLQNCRITNEGVAALGRLDGSTLARLSEIDISYNRSINDSSIMAVYHAVSNNPEHYSHQEGKLTGSKLTIHVHQTAVSKTMQALVDDFIRLLF